MRGNNLWAVFGLILVLGAVVLRLSVLNSETSSLLVGIAGVVFFLVYFFRASREVQGFLSQRSTQEGGSAIGTTAFVIGIVIFINILGVRFPWMKDITADKLFTPAPETISAIEEAPAPVEVFVFYPEGSPTSARLKSQLEAAQMEAPSLEFEIIDPDRDLARALEFGLTEYTNVVRIGEKQETFFGHQEEHFVAAIKRASREQDLVVGFMNGHGESRPSESGNSGTRQAGRLLDNRGYVVRGVNLLQEDIDLYEAVDLLVIPGPQLELSDEEIRAVKEYVDQSGRLFIMLDPEYQVTLQPILDTYGITFLPSLVSDPTQRTPQTLLPTDFSAHPMVVDLRRQSLSPVLRGVGEFQRRNVGESVRTASVMFSSSQAIRLGDAGDPVPGRRSLAVAGERRSPRGDVVSRIAVVGDVDWVTNTALDALGNGDLFLSTVRWLTEQDSGVTIRPRQQTTRPVIVSRQQGRALLVLLAGLLPVAVLFVGGVVWWRRR